MIVLSLFKGLIEVPDRRPTRREIALLVAERNGLRLSEMISDTRAFRYSHPRQEAMWHMAQHGYNRCEIGRTLKRTSWTVRHGVERHEKRLAEARIH